MAFIENSVEIQFIRFFQTKGLNVYGLAGLYGNLYRWAKDAVDFAVQNKILFGDERGNYKLHDKCTRQEMLVFLYRYYKLIKE